MTNLNDLKVSELQAIAKENGIALSYTENGKRHRLNKPELIAAIEARQNDQKADPTIKADTVEVNVPATQTTEIEELKVNQVTQYTLKVIKSLNCKQELQKFKNTLLSYITDNMNKSKRSLKSKWALQLNNVSFILKQAELKVLI